MVKESQIEGDVVHYARTRGVMVLKLDVKTKGWPDRMFLYQGGILFIEFKQPGEKPTLMQEIIHERIRDQGFAVVVVSDVVEGRAALNDLTETCDNV